MMIKQGFIAAPTKGEIFLQTFSKHTGITNPNFVCVMHVQSVSS